MKTMAFLRSKKILKSSFFMIGLLLILVLIMFLFYYFSQKTREGMVTLTDSNNPILKSYIGEVFQDKSKQYTATFKQGWAGVFLDLVGNGLSGTSVTKNITSVGNTINFNYDTVYDKYACSLVISPNNNVLTMKLLSSNPVPPFRTIIQGTAYLFNSNKLPEPLTMEQASAQVNNVSTTTGATSSSIMTTPVTSSSIMTTPVTSSSIMTTPVTSSSITTTPVVDSKTTISNSTVVDSTPTIASSPVIISTPVVPVATTTPSPSISNYKTTEHCNTITNKNLCGNSINTKGFNCAWDNKGSYCYSTGNV